MLWTEMREPPKAPAPLAIEASPRAAQSRAVAEATPADPRKARPSKKRRASIIADEATAS